MNNYAYYVADKKTGFMVEGFNDYDDALTATNKYEEQGREASGNNYRPWMYELVDTDHYPIHRYLVKHRYSDGSYEYNGVVIARDGYTGDDYAKENGITDYKIELDMTS